MESLLHKFPKDFFWGAATAAHQVEGGNRNDWTEWEKANAQRLAQSAKSRQWPDFISNPPAGGTNPLQEENYISGKACDHYHRFREDFDIAKSLGHNAHRFSIEWSRIEPEEGKFDEREIAHYREVIHALRERGIEPFVTLWHWTLPIWLSEKGGVLADSFSDFFVLFSQKMVEEFSDVQFWITLNEPEIYSQNSYLRAVWPPQKQSLFGFLRIMRRLAHAHISAYQKIHDISKGKKVGIAKNNIYFSGWFAPVANYFWNKLFLNKIRGAQDFIGLNYYFHNSGCAQRKDDVKKTSDMGWELYPEGHYHLLKELALYKKPIFITESGLADAADSQRSWYIRESLRAVAKAVGDGVDVRGYFHWSLLDNFEWDKGFWPRFGLVEVDYKTMERRIRASAWEYKKIIDSSTRLRVNPE